ncbi:c-type cytochrome domain-containing protein, partial [Algoriphagus sp.]|uniref:c-type cytochrome domain-containing protein n=1 Tax=Algoriphagus sp. TaxID=1872435 RepID=UPI0025CE977B
MNPKFLILLSILFIFYSCTPELPEKVQIAYDELPEAVDFNIHVKPILSDKCFACHGPDLAAQKAGLSLHTPDMAFIDLPNSPGKKAITRGNLRKSELFHRIISEDAEYKMPSL